MDKELKALTMERRQKAQKLTGNNAHTAQENPQQHEHKKPRRNMRHVAAKIVAAAVVTG